MTMIFWDGFDSYGSTADLLKYQYGTNQSSAMTWDSASGRLGGGGLLYNAAAANNALFSNNILSGSNTNTFYMGYWFKCPSAPASSQLISSYLNASGATASGVGVNTSGIIQYNNGASFTITGATNVCDGNWHWIEHTAKSSISVAQIACLVDNVTQWNRSDLAPSNTNTGIKYICLFGVSGRANQFDDLIGYEGDGVAIGGAQFPLGPRVIYTERPNSDVNNTFTTSTGSPHYAQLNENPGDMSTYVSDTTSGHEERFGQTSLGIVPATITGVGIKTYAVNPGVGNATFRHCVNSGGVQTNSSNLTVPLSVAFNNFTFYVNDPNTSAAWTASGVNNASYGFNIP